MSQAKHRGGGDYDSGEAKRLEEKVAALGHDEEHREARGIVQRQLATIRSLEARIEDAKAQRARRFELLKTLWLHAFELQAMAGQPAKIGDTSEKLQQLFAQIGVHTAGPKGGSLVDRDTNTFTEMPTIER